MNHLTRKEMEDAANRISDVETALKISKFVQKSIFEKGAEAATVHQKNVQTNA